MRYYLIRIDDVCETMDWEIFCDLLDKLRERNIKPLLGVVPYNCDKDLKIDSARGDFWPFIKGLQDEGYPIALHGYKHIVNENNWGIVGSKKKSEFAGKTYREQYQMIHMSNDLLKKYGIITDIFFAPYHSYDYNTIRALKDNGFVTISDGFSIGPYIRGEMLFIPCMHAPFSRISKLFPTKYQTIALHPNEWRLQDKNEEIKLMRFIKKTKSKYLSFADINEIEGIHYSGIKRIIERVYVFINRYTIPYFRKMNNKKWLKNEGVQKQ